MKIILCISILALLGTGCTSMSVNRYTVSPHSLFVIRKLEKKKVNVGKFHDALDRKKINCRAVPVYAPGGETYAEYIQKALTSELIMADVFEEGAAITLTATLETLELRSLSGANWEISIKVNSSNGHSIKITEIFKFESAFDADNACRNAAEAFVPAVQNLIFKLISNPEFKELIRERR